MYITKQNVVSKLKRFTEDILYFALMTVLWTWSQTVNCTIHEGEIDSV